MNGSINEHLSLWHGFKELIFIGNFFYLPHSSHYRRYILFTSKIHDKVTSEIELYVLSVAGLKMNFAEFKKEVMFSSNLLCRGNMPSSLST